MKRSDVSDLESTLAPPERYARHEPRRYSLAWPHEPPVPE